MKKNAIFFKLSWYNVSVQWKLKLLNFLVESVLMWVKKPCSGGSKGGARGPGSPPPPTLFLDQNEARRAEKIFFFETGPRPYLRFWMTSPTPHPPYLKVWIRQCLEQTEKNWAVPPLLACKIFSRFFRSLGRAPWNSFSNFSWKKIPCTFYAPWCKKWCLISAFTTQISGFTSLIDYWRIISLWTISF